MLKHMFSCLQFKTWLLIPNLFQHWAPQTVIFQNSKPRICFPYLPVTKAACFGLNYSQIPQGWIFAVTTLLVPIYFNRQSTIVKMFHEVFGNIDRNFLYVDDKLVDDCDYKMT